METRRTPRALRRLFATTLLALFGLAVTGTPARAQIAEAPSLATPTLQDADRAYRAGDYDLAASLTSALEPTPSVLVLRARALAARGHYDEAIRVLTPAATAAPAGDPAIELGELLGSLGRRSEADRWLLHVLTANTRLDNEEGLVRAARAARALGRFQQANDFFRDAAVIAGDAEVQYAWGELLLEKHNAADAARSFRQAIQLDRSYAPAFVGMARVTADSNPPAARQLVERALRLNPSLVAANVYAAELALDDDDKTAAREAIDQALSVNPSSLEARSLQAAMTLLDDRPADFEIQANEVLAIHPRYGEVFRVAGQHAARHYRFDEAVALARRAVALDPEDGRAHAELGMHLLRTGDEPAARTALETAFRLDPYDVVTYNLLGLLDTLDKFVTIEDGPIVMRLHPEEADVLREHALGTIWHDRPGPHPHRNLPAPR
jgi:tetratricopeptide (TPR) repeat protein